jgi:hypothetical protein
MNQSNPSPRNVTRKQYRQSNPGLTPVVAEFGTLLGHNLPENSNVRGPDWHPGFFYFQPKLCQIALWSVVSFP